MEIAVDTAATAYHATLAKLAKAPMYSSRLGDAREILGFKLIISNPRMNLIRCPARKFNYRYMLAETMWNLVNRDDIAWLEKFSKGIVHYVTDQPDEEQNHAVWAYGPKVAPHITSLLESLYTHKGTRRALLRPGRESHPGDMLGTPPCIESVQFIERDSRLNMSVHVRSNDAYMGFPYDMFTVMTWQQAIANALCIDLGVCHYYVASMHLYEKHYEQARQIIDHGAWADCMGWVPDMTEVGNGSLEMAIDCIASDGEYSSNMATTWSPGLHALCGNYSLMDSVLDDIRNAGEGVGW